MLSVVLHKGSQELVASAWVHGTTGIHMQHQFPDQFWCASLRVRCDLRLCDTVSKAIHCATKLDAAC